LNLKCDILVSKFTFSNSILYCYAVEGFQRFADSLKVGGLYKLNLVAP
jgi:hypothetical protein